MDSNAQVEGADSFSVKRYRVTAFITDSATQEMVARGTFEVEAKDEDEAVSQIKDQGKVNSGLPDPDGTVFDVEEV